MPKRFLAGLALALLCAPGTWLRTEVPREVPKNIAMARIAGSAATPSPQWTVEGVWEYSTGPSRQFGGYSALFALGDKTLRAFSDRGYRFTFPVPDIPGEDPAARVISRQVFTEDRLNWLLWDIESATRDPETGNYWLGYESNHAFHRFTIASVPDGVRMLGDEVDWTDNSGLEAMVRLSDGRFLAIPEGRGEVLIYPSDPVDGSKPEQIEFANPVPDYAVTDIAQLPDGRLLLLMRNLVWDVPPFAGLVAIATPPEVGMTKAWTARVVLRFDGVLPPENYEGIAVRGLDNGQVVVWVISDDNLSTIQRTLLAKLIFDPAKSTD